jgi:frataxin
MQSLQLQIEESENPIFEDANYSDGVLNIEMRGKKYYVLNKQTPNKQIWLSSPISGPSRFEYSDQKTWFHYRTNEDLLHLLNTEFNQNFAKSKEEKIELKYPND